MNINMPRGSDFIIIHDINKFTLDRIEVKAGFKDVRILRVIDLNYFILKLVRRCNNEILFIEAIERL